VETEAAEFAPFPDDLPPWRTVLANPDHPLADGLARGYVYDRAGEIDAVIVPPPRSEDVGSD
jgi:hypothetical protein